MRAADEPSSRLRHDKTDIRKETQSAKAKLRDSGPIPLEPLTRATPRQTAARTTIPGQEALSHQRHRPDKDNRKSAIWPHHHSLQRRTSMHRAPPSVPVRRVAIEPLGGSAGQPPTVLNEQVFQAVLDFGDRFTVGHHRRPWHPAGCDHPSGLHGLASSRSGIDCRSSGCHGGGLGFGFRVARIARPAGRCRGGVRAFAGVRCRYPRCPHRALRGSAPR